MKLFGDERKRYARVSIPLRVFGNPCELESRRVDVPASVTTLVAAFAGPGIQEAGSRVEGRVESIGNGVQRERPHPAELRSSLDRSSQERDRARIPMLANIVDAAPALDTTTVPTRQRDRRRSPAQ